VVAGLSRAAAPGGSPATGTFEAIAGASATLAGLIFVAVSLDLKEILRGRALPSVAARWLAVLVALVLMRTFGLAPGQRILARRPACHT